MSKKLAIKGHSTRGNEVIKLLKMMGAVYCPSEIYAICENRCYSINDNGWIKWDYIGPEEIDKYKIFTLEDFLEKYPFKVGDRVLIPEYESEVRICEMQWDGFEIQYKVYRNDDEEVYTAEELLDYNDPEEPCSFDNNDDSNMKNFTNDLVPEIDFSKYCKDEYLINLGNYEIQVRDGKTYAVKKKPKYPKTYEDCCDILNTCQNVPTVPGWKGSKIAKLQQLLICRDAYWKIEGEQMGLDEAWEPDWTDDETTKYCIIVNCGMISKQNFRNTQFTFAFPVKEVRDTFYENFKELFASCKELL